MTHEEYIGHYAFTEEKLVAVTGHGPNLSRIIGLEAWKERKGQKEVLLVSACIGGSSFRYKRSERWDPLVQRLAERFALVFVCPESLGRLPVHRLPYEIEVGHDGDDVLDGKGKVVTNNGNDVTPIFVLGAVKTLHIAQAVGATIAFFMDGSPACGVRVIGDGSFGGGVKTGRGVATAYLRKRGIKVLGHDDIEQLLESRERGTAFAERMEGA